MEHPIEEPDQEYRGAEHFEWRGSRIFWRQRHFVIKEWKYHVWYLYPKKLSLKNENVMCDICILKNCNHNFFHSLSTFVINKEYNYTKQHPPKNPYWIVCIYETSGKHQIIVKLSSKLCVCHCQSRPLSSNIDKQVYEPTLRVASRKTSKEEKNKRVLDIQLNDIQPNNNKMRHSA